MKGLYLKIPKSDWNGYFCIFIKSYTFSIWINKQDNINFDMKKEDECLM